MATLRLDAAGRTYPGSTPVPALKEVSLEIGQGEYVAIEGPSGSGKSTLLNLLAMLDSPTRGRYFIDGTEVGALSDDERARLRSSNISFIFQAFHLLDSRTVVDNVALGMLYRGLPNERRSDLARSALRLVGLSKKEDEPAGNLSGGERQRVAIARAIASGAPVVVADEPTGNLDSENSAMVMDALDDLVNLGTTVIVVTHDPTVAARADRKVRVVDGLIVEDSAVGEPLLVAGRSSATDFPRHVEGSASIVRVWDGIQDAWRGLWAKPRRTWTLIASVAIAVTLALTSAGLAQTSRAQVSDIFDARRNQRVALTSPSFPDAAEGLGSSFLVSDAVSPDSLHRLQDLSGVEAAAVLVTYREVPITTSPIQRDGIEAVIAPVVGSVDGLVPTSLFEVDAGGLPPLDALGEREVVLGSGLANDLELGPLAASPTVWLDSAAFTVVGVIIDPGLNLTLPSAVVMEESQARALVDASPGYANVEIRTAPGAAQQVAVQAPIAWIPSDPEAVTVDAPPDPASLRDQIEDSVTAALLTLTGVALLAAVLSLASTMSTAVTERTGEFGLRRAIGARRRHLTYLVLGESVGIGFIGGVIGSYAALLAVLGITIARRWQPVLDLNLIPLGIVGGIAVGLVGGLVATRRAGQIEPSSALRA